jgi:predicted enzyme related to lactoylglutathione lyase
MSENGVVWFSIGTDQPEHSGRFYQELFGWQYTADLGNHTPFRFVKTPDGSIDGGLFASTGEIPNHASFVVQVADVAATIALAEEVGGKVLMPATDLGGGTVYAHLADPAGNQVGIINRPVKA